MSAINIVDLMCGECGGEVFTVKSVVPLGVNVIHPTRLILTCIRPSCPGAFEIEIIPAKVELRYKEKGQLFVAESEEGKRE